MSPGVDQLGDMNPTQPQPKLRFSISRAFTCTDAAVTGSQVNSHNYHVAYLTTLPRGSVMVEALYLARDAV
jgi:hypothetical protein